MRYDLKDIAEKANISISTVSLILNDKGEQYRISQKTIQRVLQISKDFNYHPNEAARSLRLKKTKTIGFILSVVTNPFFAEIAQSIEQEARRHKYTVIIGNSNENEKIEDEILNSFISRSVDGIILSALKKESKTVSMLNDMKIPHIFVDRSISDQNSFFIGSDNYQGAMNGLNYLLKKGCKRFAFIGGNKITPTSIERHMAFLDFLKNNNLEKRMNWIKEKSFTFEWGYEAIASIFQDKSNNFPDAIFSTSWITTAGILEYVGQKKIRVPEDLKILSYDDYLFIKYLKYPLITIKQDTEIMGKYAVQLLLKLIKGENVLNQRLNTSLKIYF